MHGDTTQQSGPETITTPSLFVRRAADAVGYRRPAAGTCRTLHVDAKIWSELVSGAGTAIIRWQWMQHPAEARQGLTQPRR